MLASQNVAKKSDPVCYWQGGDGGKRAVDVRFAGDNFFFGFLESVTDQIFILAKYNFQYFQSVNFGLAFYGYFPPL